MPFKQKKTCAAPGCPNLTDERYCEQHQRQANKDYDRYHRSKENRYHNSGWKTIRAAQLHRQPLCERCMQEGRYVTATLVHHIKPLSEGGSHAPDNLMSLCDSCHGKIHSIRGDRWHNLNGTGSHNAGERGII